MRYYIEDNGIRTHRMGDAVCRTYDFAQGRWLHSTEIMDIFIGELWVNEVSGAEADTFIAKRSANSEDKGVPTGQRDMKIIPYAHMRPAYSSAIICTSARYRRLTVGFPYPPLLQMCVNAFAVHLSQVVI